MVSHSERPLQADWFNATANIQTVTEEALAAKREVLRLLRSRQAWEGPEKLNEHDVMSAAELCAREGDPQSAAWLLRFMVNEPRVRPKTHIRKADTREVTKLLEFAEREGTPLPSRPSSSSGASEWISGPDRLLLLQVWKYKV